MRPFRIVHFSDIHEALPMRMPGGFFDKRIVGAMNSILSRRKLHRREYIRLAVERILADAPDLIVFSGDAVTCGQPSEFRLALADLKPLTDSGIPLIFSPGNHDAYVRSRTCREAYHAFIGEVTNGLQSPGSYPYARNFGPLRFLVFNAARPTNPVLSCGFLDETARNLIRSECSEKTSPLVAVCHFPFRRIRKGLVNVLCGHILAPYFDLDATGRGETSCGSLTRHGAYSVIEYADGVFRHSRTVLSES